MRVLVAGGTGMLGRLVVEALREMGDVEIAVLARDASRAGDGTRGIDADLRSGDGLIAAVAGARSVIWCAHDREALVNDALCMRNLLAACTTAERPHLVYTGIAGIETSSASPYYAGKLREEAIIESSGVPFTILRATQFYTLLETLLEGCDEGTSLCVPTPLFLRPIAPETVAGRLARLAVKSASGRVPDLAGPEGRDLPEFASIWLAARGIVKPVLLADEAPERWRLLQTLTHGPAEQAGPGFAEWLARRA